MTHNDLDILYNTHSRLWHPWLDKVGLTRIPIYWHDGTSFTTVGGREPVFTVANAQEFISTVAHNELFVLCQDVLNTDDISYGESLLSGACTPFVSRQGHIAAIHIKQKKKSGFLVPASTWKWDAVPNKELLERLIYLFQLFGFQACTPASLSEKILRATLPEKIRIYRPSVQVRRDIIDNNVGGRIDQAEVGRIWPIVYEYDKNKAYLTHAQLVPSPYFAPVFLYHPELDEVLSYACTYCHVELIAHDCPIAPLLVDTRKPVEGECIDRWLWTDELLDCLRAGYSLTIIRFAYGWREMSDFMQKWVDILWGKFAHETDEYIKELLKIMAVGLPGRFLRRPEQYTLISLKDAKEGDVPLQYHWQEKGSGPYFTDYAIRASYDKESTALSPIGSYIVASMRHELYNLMRREYEHGRQVLRSYIDCYALDGPSTLGMLGNDLGNYKEKQYSNVLAEANRFVGYSQDMQENEMRAPGVTQDGRLALWKRYYDFMTRG